MPQIEGVAEDRFKVVISATFIRNRDGAETVGAEYREGDVSLASAKKLQGALLQVLEARGQGK